MRDKLSVLLDGLVDDIGALAQQISEISAPTGDSAAIQYGSDISSFLSSLFAASKYTTDQIESRIKSIKDLLKLVKPLLTKDSFIDLKDHRSRVNSINGDTSFVRVAIKVSIDRTNELNNTAEAVAHHKKIETVVFGYRALLLEFNACIGEYNRLHPDKTLSPLVSTDISPLG